MHADAESLARVPVNENHRPEIGRGPTVENPAATAVFIRQAQLDKVFVRY